VTMPFRRLFAPVCYTSQTRSVQTRH